MTVSIFPKVVNAFMDPGASPRWMKKCPTTENLQASHRFFDCRKSDLRRGDLLFRLNSSGMVGRKFFPISSTLPCSQEPAQRFLCCHTAVCPVSPYEVQEVVLGDDLLSEPGVQQLSFRRAFLRRSFSPRSPHVTKSGRSLSFGFVTGSSSPVRMSSTGLASLNQLGGGVCPQKVARRGSLMLHLIGVQSGSGMM